MASEKTGDAEGGRQAGSFAEQLSKELALVAGVVLFAGLVYTDSYYTAFQIKYQFLDLPTMHLVYRGLTVLLTSPLILLAYAVAVVWLSLGRNILAAKRRSIWLTASNNFASYVVVLALLGATYPLSFRAGQREAARDATNESSTLAKIVKMETGSGEQLTEESGYRLLLADSHYIIVLKPRPAAMAGASQSIVKRFSKEDVHALWTAW